MNYPIYNDTGIEKHKIASYQMDLKGQATLPALCNLFQEIAGNHADANDFGFQQMIKTGQIWVLTRLKIQIESYPKWNDEIFIKTWVRNREGFFSERDFELTDKNNTKIAGARSGWMLLDLKSKRPKQVEKIPLKIKLFPEQSSINGSLNKIEAIDNIDFSSLKTVEYDDIDVNLHVNNVKYIEWVMASFPYELRQSKDVKSFEINYLAEMKIGEPAEIQTEQLNKTDFRTTIITSGNGKEICRAEISWV